MVDYVRLQRTAERLITKNGRMITFLRPSRIPGDPAKPWNGPDRTGEMDELSLRAVFAPPNTVRQFGLTALGEGSDITDLFSFVQQIAIVFPGEHDLRQYTIIRDQGIDWNMIAFQLLQPADLKMVAFIGTRR